MINDALNKLQSEMDQNKSNSYIQVIGGFLLQHLEQNHGDADKLVDKDKTIAKSLNEMRKVAEKKKSGNVAVLTDQEGFAVVLKYYGIDTKPSNNVTKPIENAIKESKNVTEFDVKLEDLL